MKWSLCWQKGVWAQQQGWEPCAPALVQELLLQLLSLTSPILPLQKRTQYKLVPVKSGHFPEYDSMSQRVRYVKHQFNLQSF